MVFSLGAAWADFSKLAKLWKHTHLDADFKIKVYSAVVLSRLLYGLSSSWLNMAEQRRLNGFHCRCLRTILKIKAAFYSRVSNTKVLERARQVPLTRQLLRRQLCLYGRVVQASATDPLRSLVFVIMVTMLILTRLGWASL